MELIKQKRNEPNCFAISAVMVLRHVLKGSNLSRAHMEGLFDHIMHRGQEEWWPECVGSQKLKGIHPQEVIDWYHQFDMTLWLLERFPRSAPRGLESRARMIWPQEYADQRFWKSLDGNPAILVLSSHALAWDGYEVFDCEEREWLLDLLNHQVIEAWLPSSL